MVKSMNDSHVTVEIEEEEEEIIAEMVTLDSTYEKNVMMVIIEITMAVIEIVV